MNQYIITEEELNDLTEIGWDIGYNSQILVHKSNIMSRPYQSKRDCPVCGGKLMCHRWCIDRDCGWDSKEELRQAGEP